MINLPKILFFDLDGTLLKRKAYKKFIISFKTKSLLKKLNKKGYKIVIATGRPDFTAIKYYKMLKLNTPLIASNGSSITNPSDINFDEYKEFIDVNEYQLLYKNVKPYLKVAICNSNENDYISNHNPDLNFFLKQNKGCKKIIKDFDEIEIKTTSFLFLVEKKYQKEFESEFINLKTINYRLWTRDIEKRETLLYEIYIKGANKINAIIKVLEYYNLTTDDAICFGDASNDILMIDKLKYGVAMQNGQEEVKKIANFITKYDNDHNGIYYFLKENFKF